MVYFAGKLLTLGFNSKYVSFTDSLEHKINVEQKDWSVPATYFIRSIEVFMLGGGRPPRPARGGGFD
jgi:hypothetical protein